MGRTQIDDTADNDFTAYVSARQASLVRAAVLAGCSSTEAEDMVQTALLSCYVRWRSIQAARDPNAYVHRVLFNTIKKSKKRRWWGEVPTAATTADEPSAGSPASTSVALEVLKAALSKLSLDQRSVLVLRYYLDMSEAQTAEILSIPTGTAKSRAARGLAILGSNPDVLDLVK